MENVTRLALVIEDARQVADLLCYLLEDAGYEVTVASSAAAARAALADGPPAALVLLDIGLPDGDGIDLLRAIRADAAWRGAVVLVLSAASDNGAIMRALAAGADDYLIKPFQPWELLEQLKRLGAPR